MKKLLPILIFLLVILLPTCNKTPTTPKSKATVEVYCVGGLGGSQLGDLVTAIDQQCQQAEVVNVGDWDAYKIDVASLVNAKVNENPTIKIVLIGHSFGGDTVIQTCSKVNHVDQLILIDPVDQSWASTIDYPPNFDNYLLFYRSEDFGPPRATIPGMTGVTIQGGHNDIPHDQAMIAEIVNSINGL